MTSSEELQAKLQKMWLQVLPLMLRRMEAVSRASQELASGTLTAEVNSAAIHEAHKLAGALGVFGLHQGSECALKIEQLLSSKADVETQDAFLQFSRDEINTLRECMELLEREIRSR
jgi:HPt (histidine-containing phosphotransfer) domain-containing protein